MRSIAAIYKSYMKKLILFIFLMLFAFKANAQSQFAPFKMVFLPDTHVSFQEKDDWIMRQESFVIFQDVVKSLKAMTDLNLVVFGGDLIDNNDKTYEDLGVFAESLDGISCQFYAILGDREADLEQYYSKQNFASEFRSNGFSNPDLTYWAEEPIKNVLLIGLDTSQENKFEGKLPQEELLWLDNTLKNNLGKFTVISMHHPAFESTEIDKTLWKKFILENSDEFLQIINKYPQVKLVLSGHHHNFADKNINGKIFMSLPSVTTYPNQYKVLKIFPDRLEVENKDISYKQIIKKSKNILVKSDYAKEFNAKKPAKVLNFQTGEKLSKTKVFYFANTKR
jgi:Icc protein